MDDVEKEEDNNISTKHFKLGNPFIPKVEIFKFFEWDLYVLPRKSQGKKILKKIQILLCSIVMGIPEMNH